MQFKKLHPNFKLPERSSSLAGGYDLFMPEDGEYSGYTAAERTHVMVGLGFSAAVPVGFVALILPRSGAGAKRGIELRNTVGVIDSDYRGEWMVAVTQKEGDPVEWEKGDRVYQYLLVPVAQFDPVLVEELPGTDRGEGGFGSTGN